MIPRKTLRKSVPEQYQPMSATTEQDHVYQISQPSPVSDGSHVDRIPIISNEDDPNIERPVQNLHEKSKTSWRTRLAGAKEEPVTVVQRELNSSSSTANDPIEDRETHFEPLEDHEKRQLGKKFHPPNQLFHLLVSALLKWLVTAVLSVIMATIMYVYSKRQKTLTDHDKNIYNFLVLGVSLALGMNIGSSLKAMASDIKWWILSLKRRPLKEVDLILRLDSLTAVTKLGFVAPRLAPICLSWILLNLVGQIGLALLGLTYSPDSVTDKALLTPGGNISITNFADLVTEEHALFPNSGSSDSISDKEYTANSYGNIALSLYSNDTNHLPPPGTLWSPSSPIIFVDAENNTYMKYVFMETNYDLLQITINTDSNALPPTVFTNRTFNTTWSCTSFPVVAGGNGNATKITVMTDSNGTEQDFPLPVAPGMNQTTFITNTTESDCGDGCTDISAFETSNDESWWYQCQIFVSDTQNATLPAHTLGAPLKSLAAQGIALQGRVRDPKQAVTGVQYQSYPATSLYGSPMGGNSDNLGLIISYFATGVIAVAGSANPQLRVIGDVPEIGSQLRVEWTYVSFILGLTVFLQLCLFVVVALVSNLVIVKDGSPLSTARLLRPILDRMGSVGTNADGKQIISILGEGPMDLVVYSVRHPQKGTVHHLELGQQKRLRAFPRGDYD